MRKSLKHLIDLQARASSFSVDQAKAFCLLCIERQKFAYDKAATVVRIEDSNLARDYLDALWRREIPLNPLPMLEPTFWAEDAAANFIYSVYEFAEIGPGNTSKPCRAVAEMSLDILDSLIYSMLNLPVNSANDQIIDSDSLMGDEIARQERDVRAVEAMVMKVDFDALKEHSKIDITQGNWFLD